MQANYIIGLSTIGSIVIGVLAIFAAQAGFALLGMALGFTPIRPREQTASPQQVATGGGIWWGITSLISIFLGAWIAGRLSGNIGTLNAVLTGILTWAVSGLIAIYLVTTAVGSLLGGVLGTVMNGLKAIAESAGKAVSAAGAKAAEKAPAGNERLRQEWPRLRDQFETILRQTGKPELQPETVKTEARRTTESAKQHAQQAAQQPQSSGNIEMLFRQVMQQAKGTAQAVDKNAVANVIEQRTHMSHEQAQASADQWVSQYRQAVTQMQEKAQETKEKTKEAVQQGVHTLGIAALWTFLLYIASLAVSVWGGWAGAVRG